MNDVEGEKAELRFLRDTLGREVDFVVLRKGKPWMLVEAKLSEMSLSPHLKYFAERISVPYAFQVVLETERDIAQPEIAGTKIRIVPASRLLMNLP